MIVDLSTEQQDIVRSKIVETRVVLRAIVFWCVLVFLLPIGAAAQEGERRGEIGLQIGVRKTGDDIVPEDSNGLGFVYGVEGAWA